MESVTQTHSLSTAEPLTLIETYLYTQRQSPNPKFIYKAVLGANRRQHTLTGSRRFFSPCMISSQSGAKPLFRQCLERQNCFHLTLSRHQIIKTSLCTISKNSWVLPFLVNLTPVTMKLKLTVFLDHPVCVSSHFWPFTIVKFVLEKLDKNLGFADPRPPQLGQIPKFFQKLDLKASLMC